MKRPTFASSAGVGRTGTLIAVDWLMQECRASKVIDVFSTVSNTYTSFFHKVRANTRFTNQVLRLRDCRMRMVQSEVSQRFLHSN